MRRSLAILAIALLAACSDDPPVELVVESLDQPATSASPSSTSTTTEAPVQTTVAPTTTSTTVMPTTSLPPEGGMCGDWIPVVTDSGTTCVDPRTQFGWQVDPAWFDPAATDVVLPPVLVVDQDVVSVLDMSRPFEDQLTFLFRAQDGVVDEARMLSDGSVITQESVDNEGIDSEYWPSVVISRPDGTREYAPGVRLFDVATTADRELAVVGTLDAVEGGLAVATFDVETFEIVHPFIGWWSGENSLTRDVDVNADLALFSGWIDVGDFVLWRELDGTPRLDLSSPTDGLGLEHPEKLGAASTTPDATTMLWATRPSWEIALDELVDHRWRIDAIDVATGEVRLAWEIPWVGDPGSMWVDSTFHTGDFVIVNRSELVEYPNPRAAFIIDLRGEEPDDWQVDVIGHLYPITGH